MVLEEQLAILSQQLRELTVTIRDVAIHTSAQVANSQQMAGRTATLAPVVPAVVMGRPVAQTGPMDPVAAAAVAAAVTAAHLAAAVRGRLLPDGAWIGFGEAGEAFARAAHWKGLKGWCLCFEVFEP